MPVGHGGQRIEVRQHHLESDRNQMRDLAEEMPDRLDQLRALWDAQADLYNGYPMDDRTAAELSSVYRPTVAGSPQKITLYPNSAEVPERAFVMVGRSFTIAAYLTINDPHAEGIIYSAGGRFGGHSLYLKGGLLHYVYNWLGELEQRLDGSDPLPIGPGVVGIEFEKTGSDGASPLGDASLHINGVSVATGTIKIQPAFFSLSGEGMNVGRDRGQPVSTDYQSPFALRGAEIDHIELATGAEAAIDVQRQMDAAFRRD